MAHKEALIVLLTMYLIDNAKNVLMLDANFSKKKFKFSKNYSLVTFQYIPRYNIYDFVFENSCHKRFHDVRQSFPNFHNMLKHLEILISNY
jgi:hypothetical protein